MIIVIDGPSGSGKSSTARAVAGILGIQYLDSGALYRAVTVLWIREGKTQEMFLDILSSKDIRFEYLDGEFRVWIYGEEITGEIRRPAVSDQVSRLAAIPDVRRFVNNLMRRAVRKRDFIADGRDLGTAVFPDADLKFYLDASPEVRAVRRHRELKASGEKIALSDVRDNLIQRDRADRSRELDPLAKADDALLIDGSDKSFDEQVREICTIIQSKLNLKQNR